MKTRFFRVRVSGLVSDPHFAEIFEATDVSEALGIARETFDGFGATIMGIEPARPEEVKEEIRRYIWNEIFDCYDREDLKKRLVDRFGPEYGKLIEQVLDEDEILNNDDPTQRGSLDYPATPWGGCCD